MLLLLNAEVIVDNGVLRTAADVGLNRIWVGIYCGAKMGGWVYKLERCEPEEEEEQELQRLREREGGGVLPRLIQAKVGSGRRELGEIVKKKNDMAQSCRKNSGRERVKKKKSHP